MSIFTSKLLKVLQPRHVPISLTVLHESSEKLQPVCQSPMCSDVFEECGDWLFTGNVEMHGTPANSNQKANIDAKITQTLDSSDSKEIWSHQASFRTISTAKSSDTTYLCGQKLKREKNGIFQTLFKLSQTTNRCSCLQLTKTFLRKV